MRLNRHLLLLVAVGTAAWTLGSAWQREAEPKLHNRPLSDWACELVKQPVAHQAVLIEAGGALVPYLVQEIRRPGLSERDLHYRFQRWLLSHVPVAIRGAWPAPMLQLERRRNAVILLGRLGPEARTAVPELVRLLDNEEIQGDALAALAAIGPRANLAIPKLIQILEEEPVPFAFSTLLKIGADPTELNPLLLYIQSNGPPWLRLEISVMLRKAEGQSTTLGLSE